MLSQTSSTIPCSNHRSWSVKHECVICGSKSIGTNFGASTCAPCKAFFRRNARRRELLQTSCPFQESYTFPVNDHIRPPEEQYCSQVRYCAPCRLRRCFHMGMKEELVRTDEQNQRYRQLVDQNRRRRQQLVSSEHHFVTPQQLITRTDLLHETDWTDISNLVFAYDTHCLKNYIQRRLSIFNMHLPIPEDSCLKITHHALATTNNMTSFISFLSSIPTVQSLPKLDRAFLYKHNIRPLILVNLHELDQLCFSEPWQLAYDNLSTELVCGTDLFSEMSQTKSRAEQVMITDSVVTRLWLLALFFSTPLNYYYEQSVPDISDNRRVALMHIQHAYITLLWNYLLHRHGDMDAVRIFANLTGIYLRMQRLSQAVNTEIRTRNDLSSLNDTFSRTVILDSDTQ